MVEKIANINLEIKYVQGMGNAIADFGNRQPRNMENVDEDECSHLTIGRKSLWKCWTANQLEEVTEMD